MPNCADVVYSEDYYDILIDYNRVINLLEPECLQRINATFDVGYYSRTGMPPLSVESYTYSSIPNCFCLTDTMALESSNILLLQNQPSLNLKGQGVLIGFVDTGIDYQNTLFRNSDGSTRIAAIWDQTLRQGTPPEGFLYGSLFTEAQINEALNLPESLEMVPSVDENGHGTFLAGIAAGGEDPGENFIGAVPMATLAVVKCKQAKKNLRDFYYIPEDVDCYQENDIMAGVAWLSQLADALQMPLSICISMGSSMGSHSGASPLSAFLNMIGMRRGRAISIAAGNEANTRHHYLGTGMSQGNSEDVELSVGEGIHGFVMELWASSPELYQVGILSPTGELFQAVAGASMRKAEHFFLFENTTVTVEYEIVEEANASLLIFIRFTRPLQGIWNIRVTARQTIRGEYHIWLPVKAFLPGEVFFLRSNPDVTATIPSFAPSGIAVGAYQPSSGSLYPESGRGYSTKDAIKPDLAAPGVEVTGPGLRGNFVTMTGTSISAAITAGACAQFLQWGIVDGNYTTLNSTEIGTILIRGARRGPERSYPNREWGYGALDAYESLNRLRNV